MRGPHARSSTCRSIAIAEVLIGGSGENVKLERGSRALEIRYFSPKNTEKWGAGQKRGGSIDPLDPSILTGLPNDKGITLLQTYFFGTQLNYVSFMTYLTKSGAFEMTCSNSANERESSSSKSASVNIYRTNQQ